MFQFFIHHTPVYEEYKKWHKQSYSTDFSDLTVVKGTKCKKQNLVLLRNIAESSLGIEHIFREWVKYSSRWF